MNVPCRFYQQGNCRNGNNCKFAHVKTGGPPKGNPKFFSGKSNMPPHGSDNNSRPPKNYGNPGHYSKKKYHDQKKSYNNSYQKLKQPRNPPPSQMGQLNTENVNQTFEVVDLKQLNSRRKQGGLGNLFISSVVRLDKILLLIIKNNQFVVLFNLENNQFMPDPLYINCDINEKILSIKSGQFGNIEGEFIFVNYINFNNLSLQYCSRLLITPKACLDSHKTFLILNISEMGEISEFYIDQQVILTAVFDKKSNQSELKMAMIQDIAKHSSDLKQLSKFIESSFNSMVVEGEVTSITRVGTSIIVALSTGRLFVMEITNSTTQYIENISGATILLEMINFGGTGGGEVALVTGSGEIKLATLGNPLQCRMNNQMNTAFLKARSLLFNQGKS